MRKRTFDYQSLELESVRCPICGGKEFEVLAKTDRYSMGISTSGCAQCGLVMTNPRPDDATMEDFYRFHYRNYYESVEVPDLQYIRKIHKDVRARYTADYLEGSGVLDKARRVLDFGCGEGSLLKELSARRPGLETEAVEPGEAFREFAREYAGCKVYAGLESLLEDSSGDFDLVIVNHVLEHLLLPNEILESLAGLISESGCLFLDVPAIEGYRSIESLHIGHMYHFSENTLRALAESTGYRVKSIEHHNPPNHPISTRCLIAPDSEQGRYAGVSADEREAWSRIRDIDSAAWKYFLTSSYLYKAAALIPRRMIRLICKENR